MSDAFFQALNSLPVNESPETEYRLYYNPKTGSPLFYTTTDEPGTYIVIDKKTYDLSNYHCVIENGKIINLNITGRYKKLVPSNTGTTTHKHNVMIIAEQGQQWALKTYDD